jgi:glycosyltransferase 2 family protein
LTFLKRKRFWAAILALALTIYLFRDFDFDKVWTIIKSINFWYLIPLSIFEFAIAFIRSQRWKYIIDPGKKISTLNIFSTFSIGMMMNLLMPALTGQVARIFLLAKKEKIKKTAAFSSVVLEVLFDALVLFGLLFIISLFYVFPSAIRNWEIVGGIIVLVLTVVLFWMSSHHKEATRILARRKFKTAQNLREKLFEIRNSFISGLTMLRSSKHLLYVTGLTVFSWMLQAVMVYLMIAAFGLKVNLWGAMVVMIINTVMVMIVITPVNIGTFQLACVFALSLFDVDKQTAFSFSLLLHTFNYLPPLLLGWYFSFREGLSFKKLFHDQKNEDVNFLDEAKTDEIAKN